MEGLIAKAQNGDEEAFYILISQIKDRLYKTAYSYLRNEHSALEAVSETTCRAYINIGKLKNPQYFSSWIMRILINYCLDEIKYSSKNYPFNALAESSVNYYQNWRQRGEEGTYLIIYDEQDNIVSRLDLMSSIKLIKPKYRDVIIMKYLEDIPIEDISKALGRPEGTIKTWISRGLKQLRSNMKGSEEYV